MSIWLIIYFTGAFIAMVCANHPKHRDPQDTYAFIAVGLAWPFIAIILLIGAVGWTLNKSTTLLANLVFRQPSEPQQQIEIPQQKPKPQPNQDGFEIVGKL